MKEYSMDQDAEINIEEMFKPENIIPALVPSEGNEELLKRFHISLLKILRLYLSLASQISRGGYSQCA